MDHPSSSPLTNSAREIGRSCILMSGSLSLQSIALVAAALVGLFSATELCAQTLEGRVIDVESEAPVEGAMVVGEDADGQVGDRVLTRADGSFLLRAGASFELAQLRIERIGYGSTVRPLGGLDSRDPLVIRVSSSPIMLEGVGAIGENLCGSEFASSDRVYGIWLEVRKALEITRLSQTEEVLGFAEERVVRSLDPDDLEEQDRSVEQRILTGEKPYHSLTGSEMTEGGWVEIVEDGSVVYHAPDAAALLSDEFTEQHCFQGGIVEEQVLLRFSPHPSRESIPEIEGELILDGDTHELTTLRFRYASIPLPEAAEGRADGEVRFTLAPNGLRIVRDWWIRMPVLSLRQDWIVQPPERRYRVDTIREEGGRVLSIDTGVEVIELLPAN